MLPGRGRSEASSATSSAGKCRANGARRSSGPVMISARAWLMVWIRSERALRLATISARGGASAGTAPPVCRARPVPVPAAVSPPPPGTPSTGHGPAPRDRPHRPPGGQPAGDLLPLRWRQPQRRPPRFSLRQAVQRHTGAPSASSSAIRRRSASEIRSMHPPPAKIQLDPGRGVR